MCLQKVNATLQNEAHICMVLSQAESYVIAAGADTIVLELYTS